MKSRGILRDDYEEFKYHSFDIGEINMQ